MKGFAALGTDGPTDNELLHGSGGIQTAVIPSIAAFPLLQHAGVPAERLVSVGDRVFEGMVIAREAGELSSPIHSSIPGVVSAIRSIRLPNGERSESIIVRLEGEFVRPTRKEPEGPPQRARSRDELLGVFRERGLVTLDSDSVPLHVQWRLPKGKSVRILVVSLIREEPYITAEERLAELRPDAVAQGLEVAIRVLNPSGIVLARGEVEPDAGGSELVEAVGRLASEAGMAFSVKSIGSPYLRGGRRELVRAMSGERIPVGASILDSGVVVTNPSTLTAVHDAVNSGKPLVERYVSVAGGALERPATLRVRIGTRIGDLIDECGGLKELPERIVHGGPLSGSVVYDLDTPVVKNTRAIVALTGRETALGDRLPCINCGRCLSVCPEELNPAKVFRLIEHARYSRAAEAGLFNCSECGSCGVVCPSHIPLVEGLRVGKRLTQRSGQGL